MTFYRFFPGQTVAGARRPQFVGSHKGKIGVSVSDLKSEPVRMKIKPFPVVFKGAHHADPRGGEKERPNNIVPF